jgi:hypothetical protein
MDAKRIDKVLAVSIAVTPTHDELNLPPVGA